MALCVALHMALEPLPRVKDLIALFTVHFCGFAAFLIFHGTLRGRTLINILYGGPRDMRDESLEAKCNGSREQLWDKLRRHRSKLFHGRSEMSCVINAAASIGDLQVKLVLASAQLPDKNNLTVWMHLLNNGNRPAVMEQDRSAIVVSLKESAESEEYYPTDYDGVGGLSKPEVVFPETSKYRGLQFPWLAGACGLYLVVDQMYHKIEVFIPPIPDVPEAGFSRLGTPC
ncbi:hypothetical protein CENSYa_0224 [Cenarchaeum symbiosum A]|uniref:Uncharacterized protein n=1 Tax=Cenarchaeum symbiosum (strain A) TaxID=414004 RepID=A0RU50_CENSY|nr:hypothetical protein CENSYa_0224 [Cenarchaeum symbiosum A]